MLKTPVTTLPENMWLKSKKVNIAENFGTVLVNEAPLRNVNLNAMSKIAKKIQVLEASFFLFLDFRTHKALKTTYPELQN